MNPINALLAALAAINAVFIAVWGKSFAAARTAPPSDAPAVDVRMPTAEQISVGFVTAFFDTLGIGCYAPTTAWFKLRRIVNDRIIPGTMTVGHGLSTAVQTFIFTAIVPVDPLTLFSMVGAATLGAFLGSGVVAKWPKRKIQIGMGSLLFVAAILMFVSGGGPLYQLSGINLLPGGGDAIGVSGAKLAIAVAVNFGLGALMTLGIGLYAPCMITISLLGMNPTVAFPVMMGSCALLMPVAGIRFIKERSFNNRAALGLAFGSIPAVLVAAYIVVSMDVNKVKWLVVGVVLYTSVAMLRSAFADKTVASAAVQAQA